VIYFWRKPVKAKAMPTITAEEALSQFRRDPLFLRLNPEEALIEIQTIQFGYYALPPAEFQRYYVPVYAIAATARTREFERYDFRRYVVGVRISSEEAKQLDVVANPAACRMF
jgi:hypothetical protein